MSPVLSTDGILRNFTAEDFIAAGGGGDTVVARVSGIDPKSAMVGSHPVLLRVLGSGFTDSSSVQFNGPSSNTRFVSATELEIEVDPRDVVDPHKVSVRVEDAAGAKFFSFTAAPITVTGLEPDTAQVGGEDLTLHVAGTGFTSDTVILFNGGEEPTTLVSGTEVTTIVKPSTAWGPASVPVTVVNSTTDPVQFEFTAPALELDSLDPAELDVADGQTALHVTGAGFMHSSSIKVDGTAVATEYVSPTELTAQVDPAALGAGAHDVTVDDYAGTALVLTVTEPAAPVPVISIPDATVQAGGEAVDMATTLDGDPDQDISDATGRITISGGAVLADTVTMSMSWRASGTRDVAWAASGDDLVGTYGPFGIAAGSHGDSTDTVQATADAPAGTYSAVTDLVDADDAVLASDGWTLTVTAAEDNGV